MCGMCEKHVNNAVLKCANVAEAKSSHADGITEILANGEIDKGAIMAAVENEGYKAIDIIEQ